MWNYESKAKNTTGYEDVIEELRNDYTKEKFKEVDEFEQNMMIEEVFDIYREKDIFPINYYNEKGIEEEIKKCIDKDIDWEGNVLDFKYNQGGSLCRFLFHNLHKVECKTSTNNSMHHRFYDDHKLKRAIKLSLSIKKSVVPSEIRGALELIGGNVATNFKPMNAKALYERYTPKNGIIYDFACGFGGRMLGALSSKNNYRYVGVEPCEETYANLQGLGKHIERTTGRKKSFNVFKIGSEKFKPKQKEFADFAFSSPPYFNLERYSEEETQCYVQFPTLEEWYEGYVRPTIKNIHRALKPGRYYAVNIADFKMGKKEIEFVDEWIKISQEEGFEFTEHIFMSLTARKGVGHGDRKKEGIFVFKKI